MSEEGINGYKLGICRENLDTREVPQIIGTMAAMCISDFEIFAKNLFYTWGTKGFHQKKSLGCAKNSFSSDF